MLQQTPLRYLLAPLLLVCSTSSVLHAQAPRAQTPTVTVIDPGVEPREREAWAFDPSKQSLIQVSMRTVENARTIAEVDKNDISIRRMYTLRGSFLRTSPITSVIWRINDASARHHDPRRDPVEQPEGPKGTPKFGGAPIPEKVKNKPNTSKPIGNTGTTALRKETIRERFATLTNGNMNKLNGASIKQKVEPAGIISTGAIPTLDVLTQRIYSEAMNLVYLLGLGEAILPETPIGIGARWQAQFENEISGVKVKTTITWTLKSKDEDTLRLGVVYQRRRIGDGEAVLGGRINRDGLGEITIDLKNPLQLDARLVQLPNADNPYADDVSWITIKPVILTEEGAGRALTNPRNER